MNILDENVPDTQRRILRRHRIPIAQIGNDFERKGMTDEEILTFLQHLRRATFFTRDVDFCRRNFCHNRYCLVWLDVSASEVAAYVRRFLAHREFNTKVKRMGSVIGVSPGGLTVWRLGTDRVSRLPWNP